MPLEYFLDNMQMCIRDSPNAKVMTVDQLVKEIVKYRNFFEASEGGGVTAVSYTHLDVYKRQRLSNIPIPRNVIHPTTIKIPAIIHSRALIFTSRKK